MPYRLREQARNVPCHSWWRGWTRWWQWRWRSKHRCQGACGGGCHSCSHTTRWERGPQGKPRWEVGSRSKSARAIVQQQEAYRRFQPEGWLEEESIHLHKLEEGDEAAALDITNEGAEHVPIVGGDTIGVTAKRENYLMGVNWAKIRLNLSQLLGISG